MIKLTIDGQQVEVEQGQTVLDAAKLAGAEIPTLCHHPAVPPAGACRICLVEVDGANLMQPACHTKVAPDMVIRTDTPRVDRNRQFILSLHMADTLQDRQTAEDNNPSRLFELADTYGTAGEWVPVVSPRQGRPSDSNPLIEFRADRCIACSLCTRYCD